MRMASPIALEPDAQAVTEGIDEPRQSKRIAIRPAAMLAIIMGTKGRNSACFLHELCMLDLEGADSADTAAYLYSKPLGFNRTAIPLSS